LNPIKKKLCRYLCITFSITYLCWGSLAALIKAGLLTFTHPFAVLLHLAGGFGPSIAALFVPDAMLSAKSLFSTLFHFKKNSANYMWTFAILEILVIALSSMECNPGLPLYLVPLIFVQAVFLFGGNEELGWRGTMQPPLEGRFPFPVAALITGVVWGVWHLPLWFVDGASQQNIPFLLFLLLGIFLSFFFAAVYRKTNAVFSCCLLHGLTNTLLSLFVVKVNVTLVAGLCLMLAYSVFLWYSDECPGRKFRNRTE